MFALTEIRTYRANDDIRSIPDGNSQASTGSNLRRNALKRYISKLAISRFQNRDAAKFKRSLTNRPYCMSVGRNMKMF